MSYIIKTELQIVFVNIVYPIHDLYINYVEQKFRSSIESIKIRKDGLLLSKLYFVLHLPISNGCVFAQDYIYELVIYLINCKHLQMNDMNIFFAIKLLLNKMLTIEHQVLNESKM